MSRLPLTGGAYMARSVIASAQRSLNLIPEPMPQGQHEPAPTASYPTPGLRLLGTLPQGPIRGIRQCTSGGVYAVAGSGVYRINTADWSGTLLGSITPMRPYPVSMQDNGLQLVIVDGTAGGWTVDLASDAFAAISSTAFYGADRVDLLDTFLVFNKPDTPQFYSSDSLATTFDPLWFANAESYSDLLVIIAVAKREIWLLGERTTEVWFNSGSPDFPFQRVQSVLIEQGCRAKYSVATHDDRVYWLARDRTGQGVVLQGANYESKRISTYAIEAELTTYPRLDDAIGYVYSLGGHSFYVLTFPHADKTWVYDITTGMWHEWLWLDTNGVEHRHRTHCAYAVNDMVVGGDWHDGHLYEIASDAYTDNGAPIKRQRSFPHLLNDANRVFYRQFIADLETGTERGVLEAGTSTLVLSTFTGADDTPLEDYHYSGDQGLPWLLVAGGGEIEDLRFVGAEDTSPLYRATATPLTPDYDIRFNAIPNRYDLIPDGEMVFAIGRATPDGTGGYRLAVAGDGVRYQLSLAVLGGASTTIPMGTLAEGGFQLTMSMLGASVTARAKRTDDGLFLRSDGVWVSSAVNAVTMTDTTWTAPGAVMIGGAW